MHSSDMAHAVTYTARISTHYAGRGAVSVYNSFTMKKLRVVWVGVFNLDILIRHFCIRYRLPVTRSFTVSTVIQGLSIYLTETCACSHDGVHTVPSRHYLPSVSLPPACVVSVTSETTVSLSVECCAGVGPSSSIVSLPRVVASLRVVPALCVEFGSYSSVRQLQR